CARARASSNGVFAAMPHWYFDFW
nr:immunoglobulin heavy chain junction region [Macaca mulatta]